MFDSSLHSHTPTLSVIDPRGLTVRTVRYHRTDPGASPVARIERCDFDGAGRLSAQWDARLAHPCQTTNHSLSGIPLRTDSVDAGWRIELLGDASQVLKAWDGRGSFFRTEFDNQLRPVAHFEKASTDTSEFCVERLSYGGPSMSTVNACGRLVRHDDSAGSRKWESYRLLGGPQSETRRFLQAPTTPNWPTDEGERDALLESTTYNTTWKYDATGAVTLLTDARSNERLQHYTVGGSLANSSVRLAGGTEQTVVSGLVYNAFGQVQSQTAGNGVVSTAEYDYATGRLARLSHFAPQGGATLQDFAYTYDPAGNINSVEDRATPERFWKNYRSDGLSTFDYDTLYQLIQATGRENAAVVTSSISRPIAPLVGNGDARVYGAYTQIYDYDAAGNMTRLQHTGLSSYTQNMVVSDSSNRSLHHVDGNPPPDLNAGFDANGNLLTLESGATLTWNPRNELSRVTVIQRKQGKATGDDEIYCYGAGGQRVRKICYRLASKVTNQIEVRYLPGLELHTDSATGESYEVVMAQAGRASVRVLRWTVGKPSEIPNDQMRYQLNDHIGSITLELDSAAALLSSEGYYPYGGTAWWTPRNEIESIYKSIRYSGKERDVTGLYYFGQRYYAPWLYRWLNPDPAGIAVGLNRYQFVCGNPISLIDPDGQMPISAGNREGDFFSAWQAWTNNWFDARTNLDRAVFWMTEAGARGPSKNMIRAQGWAQTRGARTLELTEGGHLLNALGFFEPNLNSLKLRIRITVAGGNQAVAGVPAEARVPIAYPVSSEIRNLGNAAKLWDLASIKYAKNAAGVVNAFAEDAERAGPWGLRTWLRLERPILTGSYPTWKEESRAISERNDSVRMIIERDRSGSVIGFDYRRDIEPPPSLTGNFVREAPGRLERAGFLASDRVAIGPRNWGVGLRSQLPEVVFGEFTFYNEWPDTLTGRGTGLGVRPGPKLAPRLSRRM